MKNILFVSHSELLELDSIFAKSAKENFGYESIVIVHGDMEAKKAVELGFTQVFDISLSMEKINLPYKERKNIVTTLSGLELDYGKGSILEDIITDRNLNNRLTEEWSLFYLFRVYEIINEILLNNTIVFGIGEVNYASYRLIRKILAVNKIDFFIYIGAPLFDNRFFIDKSFFLESKLFQKELSQTKVIPKPLIIEFKSIISALLVGKEPVNTKIEREKIWDGEETLFQKLKRNALSKNLEFWKKYYFSKKGKDGLPFRPLKKEMLIHNIIKRRIASRNRKKIYQNLTYSVDFSEKYCIYFLHHTPEYTIDTLGGPFRDQIFLIKTISESLPLNQTLYVKEHVVMIGLRPSIVYQNISKIPGVKLISNDITSHRLIKKANIVFTVSGTAAIEAMINDVPAIMFSHYINSSFPGIHRCLNLFKLSKLIYQCLNSKFDPLTEEIKLKTLHAIYNISSQGALMGYRVNWLDKNNVENLKIGFKDQVEKLLEQ